MNTPETIAIKLTQPGERAVKQGHPWVFDQSIEKGPVNTAAVGSLCVLFDRRTNRPYAFGLWDPGEIIRIRIVHRGRHLKWNEDFLKTQLQQALLLRKSLQRNVNGYRAIHGENDGFPGLVLDVYDRTGVVKIYSAIWIPYLKNVMRLMQEVFRLERLVFRRSRKLVDHGEILYEEGGVIGQPLSGEKIPFEEYGVSFYANPVSGHKTGFFLDQRANRYWVQNHASGRSVLDVFSYVGGFGIHALKGGAASLTSLDISAQAMEVARENLLLNGIDLSRWSPVVGDAFNKMTGWIREKRTFDMVILDPPSFAKQASEVPAALKQYGRLAKMGAALTARHGYLILGSCSSRISMEDFKNIHQNALKKGEWSVIREAGHDVDHPVRFPEAEYLKTIVYRRR